jgi:hypothetical protein
MCVLLASVISGFVQHDTSALWLYCLSVCLVVSCDCEKAAVAKVEDRLVTTAVSCRKLYAVGEIPVIPLKVCVTVYTCTNLICSKCIFWKGKY